VEHVPHKGEKRNIHKILVRKIGREETTMKSEAQVGRYLLNGS